MKIIIRELKREDAEKFSFAFLKQGLDRPINQFLTYFTEQKLGKRKIFVAEYQGEILGFVTVVPVPLNGPFKGKNMPEIMDFNVFEKYQKNGIGATLLDAAEEFISKRYDFVTLAVGLNKKYGFAQRMYAKRGYIPDGTGLWYKGENLKENSYVQTDDYLVVYMYKELKKLIR